MTTTNTNATTLRTGINGTFTEEELRRLTWPVAWAPTMPVDEAAKQEADLHELVADAISQIQVTQSTGWFDGELAAKIKDGEVVEIVDMDEQGDEA